METSFALAASFVVYSLFIIGTGLYTTRFRKRTDDDFVLASRELGPWAASLSASASSESGWVMLGLVGMAFTDGLAAAWIIPGIGLGYLFNWYVLAERLRRTTLETGVVTLPQYIVKRFGGNSKMLRVTAVLIITTAMLGYVAAQMNAAGKAFDALFDLPYWIGVLVGAFIVLIYTLFGGFRAICWTDIIQASFMVIALIVMPIILYFQLGGFDQFRQIVISAEPEFLTFGGGRVGYSFLGYVIGMLGIGLGYPGQPHVLARFMAAKDNDTVKKAGAISMAWFILVYVGAVAFGLLSRAYFGALSDPEQALPLACGELLPPVLGGFVVAAIVSAICSTADSQLIVVSSAISRDVIPYLRKKENSKNQETDFKKTQLTDKVVLLLLGIVSILFALTENRVIFEFVLYAWSVLGASFGPVVIFGLLWKKTSKAGAMGGMLTGLLVSVIWRNVPVLKATVYELVPAFVLSLVAVYLFSILFPNKKEIK